MSDFMNNTYTAINNTLISYCGSDISLAVPEKLGSSSIREIGSGAFMESDELRQIVFKEGVEKIGSSSLKKCKNLVNVFIPHTVGSVGDQAFSYCPHLVNLYFYDLRVDKTVYDSLINKGHRLKGDKYIISDTEPVPVVGEAVRATGFRITNPVICDIGCLFTSQNTDEDKGLLSVSRNLDCLGLGNQQRYSTETAEFKRLIESGKTVRDDSLTENKNDSYIKAEIEKVNRFLGKTALVYLDDTETKPVKDMFSVSLNVKIGFHFWQSGIPVNEGGRLYYIYRRNYLGCLPDVNYYRKDVGVFNADGSVVTNREDAERIYAKYRLLSLL